MVKEAHTEVIVDELPQCDFCKQNPNIIFAKAHYDGKTATGPWANMCREHFQQYGVGLGLGKGQKLILRGKVNG